MLPRLAIIQADRCKPKKCRRECKMACPINQNDQECISAEKTSKIAVISEILCVGCGQCVKKCPFDAIEIIRIPASLEKETSHRYGPNSFKLHRLPIPRPDQVLGLVGNNGIGKSTALKILSNAIKPNLGRFDDNPSWKEILTHFRGSELQAYFQRVLAEEFKVAVKPQHVDQLIKPIVEKKMSVGKVLTKCNHKGNMKQLVTQLSLRAVLKRKPSKLSGGEMQRFGIAIIAAQKADIYMFDEPTSMLDVKQRIKASQVIRSLLAPETFIILVEHDLAILDYLSDFVCVLYGHPGAYGVVTKPFSVRDGINIFLAGFIPTENLRFRTTKLSFKLVQTADGEDLKEDGSNAMGALATASSEGGEPAAPTTGISWPALTKTLRNRDGEAVFKLDIARGTFNQSEIIVMLGENGTGKSTMIKMLAGKFESDSGVKMPELSISHKPQTIAPKFPGTVRELLSKKIRAAFATPIFQSSVIKPLDIENIIDLKVLTLSGGERQRLGICLALGKPANVYLIDEPSCYLSAEQRILCAKVIRRFVLRSEKTAFVVEHDMIMASYLASKVIVFSGNPGVETRASSPMSLLRGMNTFLKSLGITFRRDSENYRPRINKLNSQLDIQQKARGQYFYTDVSSE